MNETYSKRTFEQAVSWFVALQDEACDDKKRAGFQRWLVLDESHAWAYAEAERLWGTLDGMKATEVPGMEAARNSRAQARPSAGLGLALSVLLLALGAWWLDFSAPTVHYGTGTGQRRSIALEDGSIIEMNTRTQLQVRMSWFRRDIALQEGEASFSVAHEPFRAFTVTTGDLQIRDIGTRFNVHHKENDTKVAVLEGEVALRPKSAWMDSQLQLVSAVDFRTAACNRSKR
ncbi:MAG: FecR domain-containing protein [Methylomonas sp.]|nr:FecR domain-containing protein [Methylomonas sp.]